jgi:hypothetical protein
MGPLLMCKYQLLLFTMPENCQNEQISLKDIISNRGTRRDALYLLFSVVSISKESQSSSTGQSESENRKISLSDHYMSLFSCHSDDGIKIL